MKHSASSSPARAASHLTDEITPSNSDAPGHGGYNKTPCHTAGAQILQRNQPTVLPKTRASSFSIIVCRTNPAGLQCGALMYGLFAFVYGSSTQLLKPYHDNEPFSPATLLPVSGLKLVRQTFQKKDRVRIGERSIIGTALSYERKLTPRLAAALMLCSSASY